MFTGIIQELGEVQEIHQEGDAIRFVVDTKGYAQGSSIGDSLAVNGACMTITANRAGIVEFMTISESLKLTNLADLKVGSPVNLELAATLNTVMGGHLVSGHVDAIARVTSIQHMQTGCEIWLDFPSEFEKFIIKKGSVSLDGVSLTVADIQSNRIRIALIPETLANTTVGQWDIGTSVNLEIDQIARHVARQLEFK